MNFARRSTDCRLEAGGTLNMLIDTNVYLSRWPFRRLPLDEPQALVEHLLQNGVTQAWTGSFDGLLHKDISAVNARLISDCAKYGQRILLPFGSINPALPDWEEDLRRCHEKFKMRGIRLHPNYHGYKLTEPAFEKLLRAAAERNLLVQIVISMEDRRTQPAFFAVEPVDIASLAKNIKDIPNLRLQLLNALQVVKGAPLLNTLAAGNVAVEIATLEGAGGVANLLKSIPQEKLLFGSYTPFFIFESALLKMKESELSEVQRSSILFQNAQRLLGKK